MKNIFSQTSLVLTAAVAALFSLVICVLLVVDATNRLTKVPLDSPQFLALKQKFSQEPNNEELKQEIRELDLALRKEYFREQQFTKNGVFLLLGGIGLMLIAGKWAVTIQRKLPMPVPKPPGPDSDERLSHTGLWAVSVLIISLVGITWGMNSSYQSVLPASVEELAALRRSEQEEIEPEEETAVVPAPPTLPELPSPEEFRQSWPSFRGPNGSGDSIHKNIPTEWDVASGKGIAWKTPVPLPGLNSPIVWKDRIFLSGATEERREVYCFDAASGKIVWQSEVVTTGADSKEPVKVSDDTGYAAPTMATDGRAVFVMFANGDLAALDFSGKELWKISVGVPKNTYGHAASLATYQGNVIVQLDQGSNKDDLSKIVSYDGATGHPVWQTVRKMPSSWCSPIVVEHEDQPLLITGGDPWVIAYSPDSGKEIWRASCMERAEVGPTPVYSNGMVFAGNDGAAFAAIRVGGNGDVTETHIEWVVDIGLPDTCSPLVTDEFVLMLASYGSLACYDKKKGGEEPLWEEDLGADFTSSPGLANGLVYLFGKEGKVQIVKPTRDECQQVSQADLGEECVTSPAFQDGRIFIRGAKHLFCIARQSSQ